MLWRQIFGGDGLVNQLLCAVRLRRCRAGSAIPDYALWTLVVLAVWQFGSPMIIFLAGLRQIPQDLYEAASMDGAGPARQFFRITLPLLAPVIFFNLVLQTIEAFKAFTQAFIVSGGNGGPVDSTLFYTLYLYIEAFGNFRMGYASALAWVLLVIIAIFTAIAFLTSRYWVYYEDEGADGDGRHERQERRRRIALVRHAILIAGGHRDALPAALDGRQLVQARRPDLQRPSP